MSDGAVGPLTIIAVAATILIVIVLANTALSAFGAVFKNATGADIFMGSQYVAVWERMSQFAWAIVAVTFVAAALTVWRVIRER
jgi:carbon starvation protein CstA